MKDWCSMMGERIVFLPHVQLIQTSNEVGMSGNMEFTGLYLVRQLFASLGRVKKDIARGALLCKSIFFYTHRFTPTDLSTSIFLLL